MMFDWNDGNLQTLRNLWGQGRSAGYIAGVIHNPSRNSVIGKAHRLGLSNAFKPAKPKSRATPFRKPHVQRFREVPPMSAYNEHVRDWLNHRSKLPESFDDSCSLLELSDKRCRWPLWSDAQPERLYCGADGADMENKRPYCPVHSRMAYQRRAA